MLTSIEADRANQRIPDEDVIAFARSEDRAVLTFNRLHFLRLHRSTNGHHAGIIVCSEETNPTAPAHRIDRAIRDASTLPGQILRVNRPAK